MNSYLRGFKGPLTFQANCDLEQVTDAEVIATDLLQIASDRKLEWILNKEHGLSLSKNLMSHKDSIFATQVETVLRTEMRVQERRARLTSVEVNNDPAANEELPEAAIALENTTSVLVRFLVGATGEETGINLQIDRG